MKKVGLIINPISGMGGKVGLKGTDGPETLHLAILSGAIPESEQKTRQTLQQLLSIKNALLFFTASHSLGEELLFEFGFNYQVLHNAATPSTQRDTIEFLRSLMKEEVDLLLFAGGDGTARDIFNEVKLSIPVVGIPTGVKIHSSVFAKSPAEAGRLAFEYLTNQTLTLVEREVVDIDEEAFRQDKIITDIIGYLKVPLSEQYLQHLKAPTPQSDEQAQISIALQVIDDMEKDSFYIIGSGSTTHHILNELNLPSTLLGVDIIKNKQLIAKDVNEQEILEIIGQEKVKLVVSPMGNQGYIFGRGNQQLSDKVLSRIEKDNLIIISTPFKLKALKGRPLLTYTGNEILDKKLSGFYRVITGYGQ